MTAKSKKILMYVGVSVLFVLLIAIELGKSKFVSSFEYGETLYNISTRFIGGLACFIFVYSFSAKKILSPKTNLRSLLIFLPCMAVAVNNFPFVTFFSGEAYINWDMPSVLLYALLCLGVGFFEEMAFRGCIFVVLLQRRKNRWVDVFISIVISSVVFGLVHIVNLFAGAGIGAVVLQVGYSFLIGGMCSIILIKTGNIWYCVFLHAVYNFAGGIVPQCGGGVIWNTPEIILTAVVAVIVAAYVIMLLVKIRPEEIVDLWSVKSDNKTEQQNILE